MYILRLERQHRWYWIDAQKYTNIIASHNEVKRPEYVLWKYIFTNLKHKSQRCRKKKVNGTGRTYLLACNLEYKKRAIKKVNISGSFYKDGAWCYTTRPLCAMRAADFQDWTRVFYKGFGLNTNARSRLMPRSGWKLEQERFAVDQTGMGGDIRLATIHRHSIRLLSPWSDT